MKITIRKTLEFNDAKERQRLKKAFKGECRKRQLAILDAFCNREWNKAIELYNALPYNDKGGCPEQEYVGLYFADFFKETEAIVWPDRGSFSQLNVVNVEIVHPARGVDFSEIEANLKELEE